MPGDKRGQDHLFLIHKTDCIQIILVAVHHTGLKVQLMVVKHGQVNLPQASEHSHQYDGASLARIPDCLAHGNVVACAVIDEVCFIRPKAFCHGLPKVLFPGIHTEVHAALLCFLKTQGADIRNHHLPRTQTLCCLGHQYPDGACSQHCNPCSRHIPCLLHGMDRNCQRFNHGPLIMSHVLRKQGNLCGIHGKIVGCSACGLKTHHLQILAQIVFAVAARVALAAHHLRLDCHLLPRHESGHCPPRLHHLAGNLMSLGHGIACKWMLPMVHMDVRSTDSYLHDLYEHFPLTDFRYRNLMKPDFTWCCHYLL